jgi:hypothetical protein
MTTQADYKAINHEILNSTVKSKLKIFDVGWTAAMGWQQPVGCRQIKSECQKKIDQEQSWPESSAE